MPLAEVERYIMKNRHLPNVPAASQVETQGLDMGAIQVKTMEKVEELTLYMIELMKENEALKKRVAQLETLTENQK
jgi:hypothetical protein